ncbi:MAG: type II secretion system protein N [Acidiferrobacterales bacterium]
MKSKKLLITAGFGLAAYLFFLVSLAPASWLVWAVNQKSGVAVSLTQTRGTIWSGEGRLAIPARPGHPIDLGLVSWRLSLWRLFTGAINLSIDAQTSNQQIVTNITIRYGKIQLTNTLIQVPAQLAKEFYAPAALIAPSGQIHIKSDNWTVKPNGIEGEIELLWRNASSALLGGQPLGDYRLVATGKGPRLQFRLTTLKGDLELHASGGWDIMGTGVLNLSGTARARARPEQFEPLLMLLGKNQGRGVRKFNINIRLPINLKGIPGFQ